MLVNTQKCDNAEICPKTSHLKVPGRLENKVNYHSLAIFSSTVCLREVILDLWTLEWVSTSPYKRCPLTGSKKCRVFVEKLPGSQFGVCSWEESIYRRCLLAEVDDCI